MSFAPVLAATKDLVLKRSAKVADLSARSQPTAAKRHAAEISAAVIAEWSTKTAQRSKSFTALAIADIVRQTVNDGVVDENDEKVLMSCLERQQEVWNVLLVCDVLVVSMTLPLLVEECVPHIQVARSAAHQALRLARRSVHARGSVSRGLEAVDPALAESVTYAYLFCAGLVFYFCWLHMGMYRLSGLNLGLDSML
jgi:hypothetical protein